MATKQNPSGPVDEHAVDELEQWIDNDERLHRQWRAIVLNLKKHQNKGRYDHERAIDGFMHLANAAAQSYAKEFGDGRKWSNMFSTNTRRALATTYVESFERGRRDEDKMLNPSQGWDVFLRGKKIDTVFYSGKNTAADIKRSLVDHDGYDPAITVRKSKKSNPGRRHMACGDLSKKRCDQLNEVYESARERGYSKTRAAQQARGAVRKQLARDKRKKASKKRRHNPATTAASQTTAQIKALAARLVEGG
jgi:hypothetical protein